MFRLFISLYLLISLGLVIINHSSNLLYEQFVSGVSNDKFDDIETVSQLVSGYASFISEGKITLAQLSDAIAQPVQLLDSGEIAFLPEQKNQLQQGLVVSMFVDDSHLILFSAINSTQVLEVGPIELTPMAAPAIEQYFVMMSYLLLAGLILMWSKPLWTDLTVLIGLTKQISSGKKVLTGSLSKGSVLFPLYQALTQMFNRISELMAIQKQMIHAVSHDIRTPLARMKFSLAMLKANPEQERDLHRQKQSLLSDIKEIEDLIDNLLSFEKIDSESVLLDRQDVDLSALINNLVDKLTPLSSVVLETKVSSGISYYCDGHLLERAVQNLIVNGQKYANSKVWVTLSSSEQEFEISIQDDGSGIPKDKVESVMQPFMRLEESRNKASGGFGLGLAIVVRIVQWHKGEVGITQSDYGGAKVAITLPK